MRSMTDDLCQIMEIVENSGSLDLERLTPYLNEYIQMQIVPKHSYITQNEYTITKVYYVIRGIFSVMRVSEKGKINILAKRSAPQFIGIDSAVNQIDISTSTTMALEDCVVLLINQNYFVECLRANGDFAVAIIRNLSSKLLNSSLRSDRLLFGSSKDQLLYYIYQYCMRHYKKGKIFKIFEKNEDIADEIGVSVRTVYRAMNILKKDGVISVVDGHIILTQEQLENIHFLLFN